MQHSSTAFSLANPTRRSSRARFLENTTATSRSPR
ncbi:hypothetical protein ID866_13060 [Astraeus odoratus]|nr:hypothetical protein ID866_13060 [Astraeus odoratus]